jgi:hypothetical protein
MNRRSLIKSLFTIAVAPKILTELNLDVPKVANQQLTKSLFTDLHLLVPDYMTKLIEKYGNTNWADQWGLLAKDKLENPKLYELCQNT